MAATKNKIAIRYNYMQFRLSAWQGGMNPPLPYKSRKTAELEKALAKAAVRLKKSVREDYFRRYK